MQSCECFEPKAISQGAIPDGEILLRARHFRISTRVLSLHCFVTEETRKSEDCSEPQKIIGTVISPRQIAPD
jgi:hypothetical protein